MINPQLRYAIQSTAGAVPVRNEKGKISMQKVKVHRYVSGKRPDYAQDLCSDNDSDDDDFIEKRNQPAPPEPVENDDELNDSRLKRLKIAEDNTEVRLERRRHIIEPEVLQSPDENGKEEIHLPEYKHTLEAGPDEDESEAELSDGEIEKRREMLKKRMVNKQEEEFLLKEEEKSDSSEIEESSEYEEMTDSEEQNGPRLKPTFVKEKYRVTVHEKEKEAKRQKQHEMDAQGQTEERRRQTLRLVEETIRKEQQAKNKDTNEPHINDVCTDDEVEYEAWKLRELKRIKRDREEKEALEKEKLEIDRLRNMSEEERRIQLRLNPKRVTNKTAKGKYKFLQKYYHRGAFYLDKEDEVYKRDFAQATLEDHFDKTILPKVMQVKNFGRSGRTKYTHLVDKDTTQFDSPWLSETSQNVKFHSGEAGGTKQVFDKPCLKKRRL